MNESHRSNTGWNIALGIILMILGFIVLGAQIFTTFVTVFFLGFMLVIGGVVQFFYGFFSGSWSRFFLSLMGGVLSFIFGLIIIANPALSVATLTLLIGVLLLVNGTYKIFASILVRGPQWGWSLTAGIVTLLLGIFIFSGWPFAGLWIIGLFIGVELFTSGFLLMISGASPEEDLSPSHSSSLGGVKGGRAKENKKDNDK